MRLGEEISRLMKSGDSVKNDSMLTKTSLDKMAVNLKMFGVFMEDIIVSNLPSTCTLTEYKGDGARRKTPILASKH